MGEDIWTQEQVDALNRLQQIKMYHPYTCPNRGDGKHEEGKRDLGLLVATTKGWLCPDCGYRQNLVHDSTLALAMQPMYPEEEAFAEVVRKGTEAWADVPDATDWVEELRGYSEREVSYEEGNAGHPAQEA